MDLFTCVGMISQRLLPKKDGKGSGTSDRNHANSPLISDLVFKGEIHEIRRS